jgi:predicted ATP-dependent protease
VLILGGFLGARYAPRAPLSLSASLVFEQSYASVEGDSASLAELCALLSALAETPLKQSFAVTGSVNQHGQVQPIGSVNEKIEGFFDVCRERGLTGDQGVLIPKSNVKNLMLRRDVVNAVEAGRFQVHAVEDVDQAIELLTGRAAGARDAEKRFPKGSVNQLVEARLTAFAADAREFLARVPAP